MLKWVADWIFPYVLVLLTKNGDSQAISSNTVCSAGLSACLCLYQYVRFVSSVSVWCSLYEELAVKAKSFKIN